MFDAHFVAQIVALALAIAKQQRNEDYLQPSLKLYEKFVAEVIELQKAEVIWDEIPDVTYYAICLIAHGDNGALAVLESEILPSHGVTIAQAKVACLTKYRLRAAGQPKHVEHEREAIMAALQALSEGSEQ